MSKFKDDDEARELYELSIALGHTASKAVADMADDEDKGWIRESLKLTETFKEFKDRMETLSQERFESACQAERVMLDKHELLLRYGPRGLERN